VAWTLRGKPVANAIIGAPTLSANGSFDDREDGQIWPSDTYANQIMQELRTDPSRHEHLSYPGAGHIVLGIPSVPPTTNEKAGI
jgi:hypothetical protein